MTDDLVKRLRWRATSDAECLCGNAVCDEAADRIEKLVAALRKLSCTCVSNYDCERGDFCPSWIARKGLEGER